VTRNAVIACRNKQFKASIRSEHLLARVAVVDPELGSSVPREVTACSGMDALCQLIESYTSTGANPMTDALALAGVERAGRSLRRAYQDGADMDAREDMALAALWSGLALANAGLGAVHGFAAPLGARFQAPHGAICAILLPHVMAANVSALRAAGPDHPTLRRYADIGKRLAGEPANDDPAAIESGIRIVHDLVGDLNIPRLGRFGVTEADLPDLASAARRSSSMKYNPVPLPEETLVGILRHAL
jgi:alcohol dehydrogenase class IV